MNNKPRMRFPNPIVIVLCVLFWIVMGVPIHYHMNKEPATEGYTEVDMNVSAYCPCEKCCDQFSDGITSSGVPAEGLIIAAPPNYPFGTKMDVLGYGVAYVQDRGGAIKGDKLDLLFPSHQEALNWGRKYIKVKVYND